MLELILKEKKMQGYSWEKLARNLPVTGNALRIAFSRKSVDKAYLEVICNQLNIKLEQDEQLKEPEPNTSHGLIEANKNLIEANKNLTEANKSLSNTLEILSKKL